MKADQSKRISRRHLALLRGINVGGKNRLPMKDLKEIFVEAGCSDVQTFIQSGNVVFSAPAGVLKVLQKRIYESILARFGYKIPVILRTFDQLNQALRNNPFLAEGAPEETLHLLFLNDNPDAAAVNSLDPQRSPPDRFSVQGQEIYFHLPNGMGNSRLTNAYFDSKLSTTSTARNWATVCKLSDLMQPPQKTRK